MFVISELILIFALAGLVVVEVFGRRHRYSDVPGWNSDCKECLHCSGFWPGDRAGRLEIPGLARPDRGQDGYGDEGSRLKKVRGLTTYSSYSKLVYTHLLENVRAQSGHSRANAPVCCPSWRFRCSFRWKLEVQPDIRHLKRFWTVRNDDIFSISKFEGHLFEQKNVEGISRWCSSHRLHRPLFLDPTGSLRVAI